MDGLGRQRIRHRISGFGGLVANGRFSACGKLVGRQIGNRALVHVDWTGKRRLRDIFPVDEHLETIV